MNKIYSRIDWKNEPNISTPLNEVNLNKMDSALNEIDNRIIQQDAIKASKTELANLVSDWNVDEETGVITITKVNGSKVVFDLNIEKVPVAFELSDDGMLKMTTDDGTVFSANIGAMIPILTFEDSDTISVSVSGSGVNKTYSFSVKNGSITEDMLQPNYLAEIKVETAKSAQSMANAKISENNAKQSELNAKKSEEKALEYSNNAQPLAQSVSGVNPTADQSASGNLIYLKNSGYTEQDILSGKDFMQTTATTETVNGITATVQGNSVVFNGTPELTMNFSLNQELSIPKGSYVIKGCPSGGDLSTYYLQITLKTPSSTTSEWFYDTGEGVVIDVTEENSTMHITAHLPKGVSLSNFTFNTMIKPTTQSPDNPIRIGGLADKGYFDGELQSGTFDGNGVVNSSTISVVNKNKIPCKESDNIKIVYGGVYGEDFAAFNVVFYNASSEIISYKLYNSNEVEVTAPTNAAYMSFCVLGNNDGITITPSTAKHICVTINGMYAVIVKTQNKNLCPYETISTTAAGYGLKKASIYLKANTKYTLQCETKSTTGSEANVFTFFDADGNEVGRLNQANSGLTGTYPPTFTPTADVVSMSAYFNSACTLTGVQIHKGSVRRDYEPHQESEALIPVSSPFYTGDYIEVYADGSGQIVRETARFDGNSGWYRDGYTGDGYRYSLGVNHKALNAPMYSTHYPQRNVGSYGTVGDYIENREELYKISLRTTNTSLSTPELLKEWMIENNVYVLVRLATPTSTPLTQEQVSEFLKLRTYRGVTYVTADGEVVMRYYCDNASGETVSMLNGMVVETKEAVSKVENLGNAFEVFDVTSVSISVSSGQTNTIVLPLIADGYSVLGVVGASSDTDGVDIGGVTMDIDRVTAYVKVTNNTSASKSAKVTIQVLYIK